MRRALRGAVGVLLAVAAVTPTPSVSAKVFGPRTRTQPAPVHTVLYEETSVISEGHNRAEEMKVELALLSDVATFGYYLGARAVGENLELRGYVPNDMVRQRAVELARKSTFLNVTDALKIQTNLSMRPPLRSAPVLQRQAAELLQTNLGEAAKQLSLGVRPNGVIVVSGPADSLESKLAVSRLFRQLSGCFGVANEMTLQQVLRDGQHMVQVTRDGSLLVPPAVLGLEPQQIVSAPSPLPMPAVPAPVVAPIPTPVAPVPAPQPAPPEPKPEPQPMILPPPPPTMSPPTPVPSHSSDSPKGDAALPTAIPVKPADTPPKPDAEKNDVASNVLTAPKLPAKWSQTQATSWGSPVKKPEMSSKPSTTPTASAEQVKLPTAVPTLAKQTEASKPFSSPTPSKPHRPNKNATPTFAETRETAPPTMSWKRPGSSEASEPKTERSTTATAVGSRAAEKPQPARTPPSPPLSSGRRWPPAYEPKPPENKGHPGIITFDDDPPPPAKSAATSKSPAITAAELERKVKAACGWKTREVAIQTLPDGTLLVKVKVPNLSVEDQLTRKLLAIPEMTTPQVRLQMDVEP